MARRRNYSQGIDYFFGVPGKYKPKPPPPPPAPTTHERQEHAGRVPQPGVHSGPRQTVAPSPSAPRGTPPVYSPPPTQAEAATSPSHFLHEINDLLTPGPTAKETAAAAARLGVKPQTGLLSDVGKAVSTISDEFAKGVKATTQATQDVAKLPNQRVDNVAGNKTLGNPTIAQLVAAGARGQISRNQRGKITVPETRGAARNLKSARQRYAKTARPDTTGLSPAEQAVIPYVLKAHKKFPDVPVSVLMAQIKQESGFNPAAVSSADAQGLSQFIPGTAAEYGVKYGTGRKEQQSQVTGEAHYLHSLGFGSDPQAALSAYSGGYAAGDYNNPILTDAQASYSALDKPTVVPPRVMASFEQAQAKAEQLGIPVKTPEELSVPGSGQLVSIPGKGRYVFPFPENKGWVWSRTDMGTDFAYTHEGAPIRALGSGTIVAPIPGEAHWEGGNGLILKLDHAKGLPSPYVFLYEGIAPTVQPGQRVARGQLIAKGAITGSIEMGFSNSEGVPLAASIYTEDGMETPQGRVMTKFLHAIQQGKTRVPVQLLQVGGSVYPSAGGVAVSGAEQAVVAPSGGVAAAPPQQRRTPLPALGSVLTPGAASAALPAAFQQFQQGAAPEAEEEGIGGLIDSILKRRRV